MEHTGGISCSICGEKQDYVLYVKGRPYCHRCAPPPPPVDPPTSEQVGRHVQKLFRGRVDGESTR